MKKLGRTTLTHMYKEMSPDYNSLGRNAAYQLLLVHTALDNDERARPFDPVEVRMEALLEALYELLDREDPT